jgi:hypothetical protein
VSVLENLTSIFGLGLGSGSASGETIKTPIVIDKTKIKMPNIPATELFDIQTKAGGVYEYKG